MNHVNYPDQLWGHSLQCMFWGCMFSLNNKYAENVGRGSLHDPLIVTNIATKIGNAGSVIVASIVAE